MKTITLNVDDALYDTLLAMLQGLPKQKIEIIEGAEKDIQDVNQFAGTIKSFAEIVDAVQWQNEVRVGWVEQSQSSPIILENNVMDFGTR